VLRAIRLADAFKPGINTPIMTNYRVICLRLKLVRVEVPHDPTLPPRTNALLTCLSSREYLDVYHIVLLFSHFWVIVDTTIKDEVTWLHLFLLELNRQAIELISLVPSIKLEPEIFSQVIDNLLDQRAAVQVQRCSIMLLAFFPIASGIWYSKVLLGRLDEFLSETELEIGISSVKQALLTYITSVFYVLLLCFPKSFKMAL